MNRPTTCRSCGAEIIWCKTELGRWMPVDRFCTDHGNLIIDQGSGIAIVVDPMTSEYRGILRTSHFTTCPDADRHRRRDP